MQKISNHLQNMINNIQLTPSYGLVCERSISALLLPLRLEAYTLNKDKLVIPQRSVQFSLFRETKHAIQIENITNNTTVIDRGIDEDIETDR